MCCKTQLPATTGASAPVTRHRTPCEVGALKRPNPQPPPSAFELRWEDDWIAQQLRTNETDFDALTTSTTQ